MTENARTKLQSEWSELSQKVASTMADRGENYGSPELGFKNIGLLWTALLQDYYQVELLEVIPPHIVGAMMAAMKISRSCRPGYHSDNCLDAIAYLHLADHCAKREELP